MQKKRNDTINVQVVRIQTLVILGYNGKYTLKQPYIYLRYYANSTDDSRITQGAFSREVLEQRRSSVLVTPASYTCPSKTITVALEASYARVCNVKSALTSPREIFGLQ